ncbi:tRNA (guanine-N(7)-)-methyltransferase [Alphaproteobacteria bacterium]
MEDKIDTVKKFISSFSRRKSRGFTKCEHHLIETVLPRCLLDISNPEKTLWPQIPLYAKCYLEIGFGSGEHLAELASADPFNIFIGCEPFLNGVAQLLVKIEKLNLNNILIWIDDARYLIEKLPDHCIDRIYVLFPDPWPKRKHVKRKLINRESLELLGTKIKIDGELILATDCLKYAKHIHNIFNRLFSKFTYVGEMQGVDVAWHHDILDIHGDSSIGVMQQSIAEAEYRNKSNANHQWMVLYEKILNADEAENKKIYTRYAIKAIQENKPIHHFSATLQTLS